MDWLFERTIELAAWVAFILCIVFLCDAIWMLVQYVQNLGSEGNPSHWLIKSSTAASKFVASAIAMGILACIDHYVFDLPEEA